ncbi:MAG: 50S ribosomal protein L10 [Candidatus Neomarinimicrobiota bacterium]
MPNEKNIQSVERLTDVMGKAKAIYITDYLGLNVEDITELRNLFYRESVDFLVAKNTLLKIAAKNNQIEGLDEFLNGPTAMAISYEDPVSPAKIIKKFAQNRTLPQVKGILFEGEVLAGTEFNRIADLLNKEQLLAQLAALLKSPLTKLAMTLKAPMTNLGYALNSIKENKS